MSAALAKNWTIHNLVSHISTIVGKESGNVLGEGQRSMVESRLTKRLLDLGDLTPSQYFSYLADNYDAEVSHLVTILTTHHTFFFREFGHFEFLAKNIESIVANVKKRGESKIRVLSAACSRGQEVYSLAMFFNHHLKAFPEMSYEILGTDIDPESIRIADNGVYPYTEVKSIPQLYLDGNWQRGTGEISKYARVKSELKKICQFQTMNLLRPEEVIRGKKFDVILCRNVFIYFTPQDVEKIVSNFRLYTHKQGFFITGLSESLKSIKVEKRTLAPSVYCFDPEVAEPSSTVQKSEQATAKPVTPVKSLIPKPIRILAVDDSSSVLKLLSKIFSSDSDFELVGTATNGLEAEAFLKSNKVDAMTLDIHMPEMDGVQYLKKNFRSGHPHVVVVSSASREDARYAQEALRSGACDFVEKPALNNIAERADEIKNKIKMAFMTTGPISTEIDRSFEKQFKITNCEKKARLFVASYSDLKRVNRVISELEGDQPPIFCFFEGNSNFLEVISSELKSKYTVQVFDSGKSMVKNSIYICDFKQDFSTVKSKFDLAKVSVSVFGIVSKAIEASLCDNHFGQVLIEDNPHINETVKEVASDLFPWTSFSHLGTEFLSKES